MLRYLFRTPAQNSIHPGARKRPRTRTDAAPTRGKANAGQAGSHRLSINHRALTTDAKPLLIISASLSTGTLAMTMLTKALRIGKAALNMRMRVMHMGVTSMRMPPMTVLVPQQPLCKTITPAMPVRQWLVGAAVLMRTSSNTRRGAARGPPLASLHIRGPPGSA